MYMYVTGEGKVGERIIHHLLLALIYRNLDRQLIQQACYLSPRPGKTEFKDLREKWESKSESLLLL